MNEQSHPSTAILASYSTGDLPLPPALVVAAHLDDCDVCRTQVTRIEEAEGRLLDSLPDAPLAENALDRTLARLGEPGPRREAIAPDHLGDAPIPPSIARQGLGQRRFLKPDFWIAPVRLGRRDGWRTYLLRAPAGTHIPPHEHVGEEYVQVLTGAFIDGRIYRAGDFAENPAGDAHALRVTDDGPCVSLVAAHGGARWRGLAGMLSPLLGI